ncbi:MAG: prephenate dehydrogenase [Chitinophagales bacterium]
MQTIGIIGLGLIGGSLGLALVNADDDLFVLGLDKDADVEKKAIDMGCIHQAGSLQKIAAESDFIFFCTPMDVTPGLVSQVINYCKSGCILTDVGSSKQSIIDVFNQLPSKVFGLGGHPMAGSEQQGISGADRYLFENAVYVLTPSRQCSDEVIKITSELIKLTGAYVMIMDAAEHDRVVAAVSHLPHVVACSLVAMLEKEEKYLSLAAGGFRDTTRIASGDPDLWTGILLSNRRFLAAYLDKFIDQIQEIRDSVVGGENDKIRLFLETGRQLRDSLPARRKGLIPSSQDVICIVPDRPGVIGDLGSWLGNCGVNIADIEILRVREGDGGTIRLGVATEEEGQKAVKALKENGVRAWLK